MRQNFLGQKPWTSSSLPHSLPTCFSLILLFSEHMVGAPPPLNSVLMLAPAHSPQLCLINTDDMAGIDEAGHMPWVYCGGKHVQG